MTMSHSSNAVVKHVQFTTLTMAAASMLLMTGRPAMATTVFSDTFGSGSTVNQAANTPTANSTTYEVASTKATTSSISAGDLKVGLAATSSGFVEVEALFTASPVTLSNPGDYVDFTLTFTDTTNILLTTKSNSSLTMGLFNAGGIAPLGGVLANSGLNATAGSPYATGGSQLWQGYTGRIIQSGTAQLLARPQQSGAGTTSANQDVLFNNVGGGAYNNPVGGTIKQLGSSVVALTNGGLYTAYLRLTYDGTNIQVTNALFSGGDTSGTQLFGLGGSTNSLFTTAFDGAAFGWRYSGSSGDPATVMDVNDITITSNVPEPSTVMLTLGGLVLLFRARRYRH